MSVVENKTNVATLVKGMKDKKAAAGSLGSLLELANNQQGRCISAARLETLTVTMKAYAPLDEPQSPVLKPAEHVVDVGEEPAFPVAHAPRPPRMRGTK